MWIGVTKRFTAIQENLALTEDQIADAKTKAAGITTCLNSVYWNSTSETENRLNVGSWGKRTIVRPPSDLDLLFVLPVEVYHRFNERTGNKQSQLLQEVKYYLEQTYPDTDMRGDGQVIMVNFLSFNVEVAPAFPLEGGGYWICDTNDGGRYKKTNPALELANIDASNAAANWNTRKLIKMMKCWKRECSVPLRSFHLELLAVEFLAQWEFREKSEFYHDWMSRDFFGWLIGRANTYLSHPDETIWLGEEWKSRTESAYSRAKYACDYEHADNVEEAGREWQKIFGTMIPIYV